MSRPERESRLAENEAAQELASQPTTASLTATSATTAEPVELIGHTIETRLAVELERLVADKIALEAFTPALQGYVLHGHRLALASLLPEYTRLEAALAQANADAGRFYSALFNPREPIKLGPSYIELERTRKEMYSGGAK